MWIYANENNDETEDDCETGVSLKTEDSEKTGRKRERHSVCLCVCVSERKR